MAAFLAAVALPATSSGGEIDRLPTHAKVVALTFDASGNDPALPAVIRGLRARGYRFVRLDRWIRRP